MGQITAQPSAALTTSNNPLNDGIKSLGAQSKVLVAQASTETVGECWIKADGFNVYSNSTFNTTYNGGPLDPQLPTTSFVCTAYTYIQLLEALVNETVKSSLRTPFTFANGESGTRNSALMLSSIASFVGSPSCKILAAPSSWGTTESIQLSLSHTPSSSIVPRSSLTFQPTATLTSSPNSQLTSPSQLTPTTNSSPSQHTQRASTNTGETTKVIIGLVVAITVLVLLFTIGLGSCCVIRKRRRRKNEIIVAHQAASEIVDERLKPQMYIGQKVELDDEQRRYEMEAIDTRFELEGANEICEMPAGEREGDPVRQELSGERHSQGLEKPP